MRTKRSIQSVFPRRDFAGLLTAVGYVDVAARKPMKTDALFWIASQSKPMTAAAFMMLVDEGKASLDDPVEVGSDGCGRGGAYATNMTIDRQRGLILVWMVQHAGFPADGERSQAAFKQTARQRFGVN